MALFNYPQLLAVMPLFDIIISQKELLIIGQPLPSNNDPEYVSSPFIIMMVASSSVTGSALTVNVKTTITATILTNHFEDIKLRSGVWTFSFSNGTNFRSGIT